jgi:hypothetical protein
MIYAEQSPGFGLGNFINITPVLAEYHRMGQQVKVWFDNKSFEPCFQDCPFFTIVSDRLPEPRVESRMICRKNDMPDYEYVWRLMFGKQELRQHTYIDKPKPNTRDEYIVLMNGSGAERLDYVKLKQIPVGAFKNESDKWLRQGHKVYGCGSQEDRNRLSGIKIDKWIDGLRPSLACINGARAVISNDCGLAHAAGAMNKDLTVIWKETKTPKNFNPGKNTKNLFI